MQIFVCIDTVVTQFTTRFVDFDVISNNETRTRTKKLADKFYMINIIQQNLPHKYNFFKILFAFQLKYFHSVMTKLLVSENNSLITSFFNLLTAFYLYPCITMNCTLQVAETTLLILKLIKNYLYTKFQTQAQKICNNLNRK